MADNIGGLAGLGGYSSLTPDFVNAEYQKYLGRDADPAGLQYALSNVSDLYGLDALLQDSPEGRSREYDLAQQYGAPEDWLSMLREENPMLMVQDAGQKQLRDFSGLTDTDKLWIARMMVGEAGNQNADGRLGVLNAFLNRYMLNGNRIPDTQSYGTGVLQILRRGFDAMSPAKDPNYQTNMARGPSDPRIQEMMGIINDRLSGKLGDNLKGATDYLNQDVVMARRKGTLPPWFDLFANRNAIEINDHTFVNQIPREFYAPGQLPPWFQQNPPAGSVPAPPNIDLGALDPGIADTMAQLASFNAGQASNMNNVSGAAASPGYVFQPANITGLSYAGGSEYGFTPAVPGGLYSSGVSPATNPVTGNPWFDGGMSQGTNLGLAQPSSPLTPGGGSSGIGNNAPGAASGPPWSGLLDALQNIGGGYAGF